MARIETYGNDNKVTGFDKVIGTDVDSGRMTKNYLMRDIREYIFDGASPEVGGKLKITNVAQDTPIPGTETPEALLNNLDPILEVSKYEVLVVSLAFNDSNNEGVLTNNVYLFNKTDIIVGFEQYESTSEDFILLSSSTDNSNIIESVGDEGEDVYDGFSQLDKKHKIRKIKSNNLDVSVDSDSVNIDLDREDLVSDLLINVGTETEEGNAVYKGYDSSTKKHQFRRIISDNLTIREDGDDLFIDYVLPDLGGVKEFFVNNAYNGEDEEGSLVKPYKTIDEAVAQYIGNVDGETQYSILNPKSAGSRIVVQGGSSYFFTSQLNINGLLFEVQSGATVYYRGTEDYMVDTRNLNALRTPETTGIGVNFYGNGQFILIDKGFAYCEGTDDDGITGFRSTVVRVFDDLEITQQYKTTEEFTNPLPKTQGGDASSDPIMSSGVINKYWVGNSIELPIVVCDKDNASTVNFFVDESVLFLVSTQVAIRVINGGYFQADRLGEGTVSISNFSQNFHVYKELDSSVPNGDPIKLIANEDFSYIRLEDDCLFIVGDLYCAYGGGQYTYGVNSGGFVLDSAIRSVASSEAKSIGINKSYFYSLRECNSIIKFEDKSASMSIRNALFDDVYTCIEYLGGDGDFQSITLEDSVLNGDIKNIDLTRNNSISVQNKINGNVVNSLRRFTNKASAVSAGLMSGALFFNIETDTVDIIS